MAEAGMDVRMEATKAALTPLGSSLAAAIVCCVIYFLFTCLALFSFLTTKYGWYDVLIVSTAFRTVCMGCRAAYLAHYSPGLQGSFLAFANAGFAASTASVWLTCGAWLLHNGLIIFSPKGDKMVRLCCYLAAIPILAFGPALGVIASGVIYGAWRTAPHAALIGDRCRRGSTWGIWGMTVGLLALSITLFLGALKAKRAQPNKTTSSKNPLLIGLFVPVVMLLLIRATAGVLPLYKSKQFVWREDVWFYCLDTLPEYLSLVVLCWPKLLARISCAYPPAPEPSKDASSKGQDAANGSAQ